MKRKNREDPEEGEERGDADDIAILSSLSSTSKKARQKMEERYVEPLIGLNSSSIHKVISRFKRKFT